MWYLLFILFVLLLTSNQLCLISLSHWLSFLLSSLSTVLILQCLLIQTSYLLLNSLAWSRACLSLLNSQITGFRYFSFVKEISSCFVFRFKKSSYFRFGDTSSKQGFGLLRLIVDLFEQGATWWRTIIMKLSFRCFMALQFLAFTLCLSRLFNAYYWFNFLDILLLWTLIKATIFLISSILFQIRLFFLKYVSFLIFILTFCTLIWCVAPEKLGRLDWYLRLLLGWLWRITLLLTNQWTLLRSLPLWLGLDYLTQKSWRQLFNI